MVVMVAEKQLHESGSAIHGAFVLCTLIWGTTWAVIRVGLADMPPFKGAALRFALAGALLLVVALARRVPLGKTVREWALWLINGALSFGVSYGTVYWAEQWVPSGLAAVIFATFPLFIAVFAHFLLIGERLCVSSSGGIVLGFVGIAVIFSEDLALLGGPGTPMAVLVALFSPVSAALASVVVKKWGQDIHPLSLTSVPMLVGSILLALFAALLEKEKTIVWSGQALGSLLYLTVAGSVVTFLLYFWLLRRVEVIRLSLIAYATPVLAVLVGVILMDEQLTSRIVLGGAVVVFGIIITSRPAGMASRGQLQPKSSSR